MTDNLTSAPRWVGDGRHLLAVQKSDVERILNYLPPHVEMRVLRIMRATAYDTVLFQRGIGLLECNGDDMDSLIRACEEVLNVEL